MESKTKSDSGEKQPRDRVGVKPLKETDKLLIAAFRSFLRISDANTNEKNLRLKDDAIYNANKAVETFDRLSTLTKTNTRFDDAILRKNRALAIEGAITEFFNYNLLPSGEINKY